MNGIDDICGLNAGKIWHALSTYPKLTTQELQEKTGLSETEIYCGIGWLARENKVRQDNDSFRLGETNLMYPIGKNAGKIWLALDIWGEVDYLSLKRLTQVPDQEVLYAVGWLAREGKISGYWPLTYETTSKLWLK